MILVLAAAIAGCGPARTAAASQATPAAFDPAGSDAAALEAIDKMVTALGGAEKWAQVKQLSWELKIFQNNEISRWFRHWWDIWNGRHRCEFIDSTNLDRYKAAQTEEEKQKARVFLIAMYDLFDHQGKGHVTDSDNVEDPSVHAEAEKRDEVISVAYKAWKQDSYQLTMLFKLRDPGVKLSLVGDRDNLHGKCLPACVDVKVSFDPQVGTDLYHVFINKQSNLPELIESDLGGGRSLIYSVEEWAEVGGLKFPQRFKNVGPAEEIRISNIQIGEPEDERYIPKVR